MEVHIFTMNAVVIEFVHVEDLDISTTLEAFHNATLCKHKCGGLTVVCLHYYYVEHTICRWSQVGFQLWSIMSGPHVV